MTYSSIGGRDLGKSLTTPGCILTIQQEQDVQNNRVRRLEAHVHGKEPIQHREQAEQLRLAAK